MTQELLLSLRPSIEYQSRRYPKYLREDLVQEGFIGAMKAIQNFNPNKGVKLITYAMFYIRGAMRDYYEAKCAKHRFQAEFIDSEFKIEHQDYITEIYNAQVLDILPKAMTKLTEREQDFITRRYLEPKTTFLHVLGKEHGVSEQRAQQIEVLALNKLKLIIGD